MGRLVRQASTVAGDQVTAGAVGPNRTTSPIGSIGATIATGPKGCADTGLWSVSGGTSAYYSARQCGYRDDDSRQETDRSDPVPRLRH